MDLETPHSMAAELRARALSTVGEEQAELLFLADEYERLGDILGGNPAQRPIKISLPK